MLECARRFFMTFKRTASAAFLYSRQKKGEEKISQFKKGQDICRKTEIRDNVKGAFATLQRERTSRAIQGDRCPSDNIIKRPCTACKQTLRRKRRRRQRKQAVLRVVFPSGFQAYPRRHQKTAEPAVYGPSKPQMGWRLHEHDPDQV